LSKKTRSILHILQSVAFRSQHFFLHLLSFEEKLGNKIK